MISPRWLVQSSAAGAVLGTWLLVSLGTPEVTFREGEDLTWIVEGPMCPVEIRMEEPEAKRKSREGAWGGDEEPWW